MQNNNQNKTPNEQTPARPRTKKRRRRSRGRSIFNNIMLTLGTLVLIGITTGALLCCFGAVYIKTVIMPLASDFSVNDFFIGENSVIYYTDPETGAEKELVTLLNTTSSIWKDYDEMPQDLINATIAIEDKRFPTHKGVDWIRTAKAVLNLLTGQDVQGGSTITQQVIKNTTDYDDVTVKRKIVEIFRALELDANNSKEDIITLYLNVIYLGSGCDGVGSAARAYFGKEVDELSLAECASLISITNNPSIYSPYGQLKVTDEETGEIKTSLDYNKQRQEQTLFNMWEQGMISEEEYKAACDEELVFVRSSEDEAPSTVYSWYEELVIKDVRADLMAQYGYSTEAANMLLSSGGLSIYSCVNPEIQQMVEETYYNRENLDYTSPSGTQQLQSAITVIDNSTGDIAAVVGRVDEKDRNLLRSLATDATHQPGSAIKPLSVYGPALEMGLITPYTVADDYPYMMEGGSPYPNNVDFRFRGLVTIKQAVTNSYNTVAIQTLGDLVTTQESFRYMEDYFHIDLVDVLEQDGQISSDMNLAPLSMGGLTNGVNTRDMAEAYAAFANNGIYHYSRTYSRVEDSEHRVILDNPSREEAILSEQTTYYMTDMLQSVVSSGSGTYAKIPNMPTAGKTGTTNSVYDRWFVGYTPYYTAAVWVGYEYDEKIEAPYYVASDLWKKALTPLHEGLETASFNTPSGLVAYNYCLDSGLRATPYCELDPRGSRVATGYLFAEDVPTEYCTCHSADTVLTVCTDCPVLNPDGTEYGQYHLASEHCPETSVVEYTYPSYVRELMTNAYGNTVYTEDEKYRYEDNLLLGECTVHTTPPVGVDTDWDGIIDFYPTADMIIPGTDLNGDGIIDILPGIDINGDGIVDTSAAIDTDGDGILDTYPLLVPTTPGMMVPPELPPLDPETTPETTPDVPTDDPDEPTVSPDDPEADPTEPFDPMAPPI